MSMSLVVQQYTDSEFETNTDNTCTEVSIASVPGSYTDKLAAGETCVQDTESTRVSDANCSAACTATFDIYRGNDRIINWREIHRYRTHLSVIRSNHRPNV